MNTKVQKIIIKQIPNPDNPQLGAKYVGAKDYATPKTSRDGKIVTGIDEEALSIILLPEDEKKKKQKEIKAIRESLEKVLGKKLGPNDPFWDDFSVTLTEEEILDPLNPMDQLIERFLVANAYVAPSIEEIYNNEKFEHCVYYLYKEDVEISKRVLREQQADKAIYKLVQIKESDPLRLKNIASFIFGHGDFTDEEAYLQIKDYITVEDSEDREENIKIFFDVCGKTNEEISIKQILDRAIKNKIVRITRNVYRRDDETYGKGYDEAFEYLKLAENSGELAYLIKATQKK